MDVESEAGQVFEVPESFGRGRGDKALSEHLADWSRSRVQKLFAAGLVWREDEAIEKSTKVSAGDLISYSVPPNRPLTLRPVPIPLEVLFEDEDLIAVNKAPGMVVHPGAGTGEDTLVHALLHHCSGRLSGIGGVERPGIVHRLDRETSGVMVAAKSDPGYQGMARLFAERTLEKRYWAIVSGGGLDRRGQIDAPIGRHPIHRTRMTVREDGRSARSEWEVVQRLGEDFVLVSVRIHTGRTHQIRVHFSHLGRPLAGDPLYGFKASRHPDLHFPRVMLHAARLAFVHPISRTPVAFEAPLPDDFSAAVERLG